MAAKKTSLRSEGGDGDGLSAAAGLLPAGLRDVLPPRADWEAQASEQLLASFASYGYARVKPPLIEFEETLLSDSGSELAGQMFRVMDPVSQRMMGLRTDITLQVARIAATRLRDAARPLRLAYAGQVLRVRGTQLRPERQFAQAGFELIGSAALGADVEAAALAAEAVASLGVTGLPLDITQPALAPAIMEAQGPEPQQARAARRALARQHAAQREAGRGPARPRQRTEPARRHQAAAVDLDTRELALGQAVGVRGHHSQALIGGVEQHTGEDRTGTVHRGRHGHLVDRLGEHLPVDLHALVGGLRLERELLDVERPQAEARPVALDLDLGTGGAECHHAGRHLAHGLREESARHDGLTLFQGLDLHLGLDRDLLVGARHPEPRARNLTQESLKNGASGA